MLQTAGLAQMAVAQAMPYQPPQAPQMAMAAPPQFQQAVSSLPERIHAWVHSLHSFFPGQPSLMALGAFEGVHDGLACSIHPSFTAK